MSSARETSSSSESETIAPPWIGGVPVSSSVASLADLFGEEEIEALAIALRLLELHSEYGTAQSGTASSAPAA